MATFRAALLAAPDGVLGGHSAAQIWQLDGARAGPPEVVVPPAKCRAQRRGMRLSWRCLDPAEIDERAGFPITTVRRTLLDLGLREPLVAVVPLVDSALRQGLLTGDEIADLAARSRRHARMIALADGRAESVFESVVRVELTLSGVAPEVLQFEVHDRRGRLLARTDLAWPSRRLLVELDGFATHGTPAALQADLQRQNRLVAAGWTVLRFTWADRPAIADAVRAALAA